MEIYLQNQQILLNIGVDVINKKNPNIDKEIK